MFEDMLGRIIPTLHFNIFGERLRHKKVVQTSFYEVAFGTLSPNWLEYIFWTMCVKYLLSWYIKLHSSSNKTNTEKEESLCPQEIKALHTSY